MAKNQSFSARFHEQECALLLKLPRILCLHGGGSTGDILSVQMHGIISKLKRQFRFVFADGPFLSEPGPGILPAFKSYGPNYRRWFQWPTSSLASNSSFPQNCSNIVIDHLCCREELFYALNSSMEADNRLGATGEWVGLLGFSQGAKVAASLFLEQALRRSGYFPPESKVNPNSPSACPNNPPSSTSDITCSERILSIKWRFAIIIAGRAPLISLSNLTENLHGFQRPEFPTNSTPILDLEELELISKLESLSLSLHLPTLHIHGLRDRGIDYHRALYSQFCSLGQGNSLIEWDGGHSVPSKESDTEVVVQRIMELSREVCLIHDVL